MKHITVESAIKLSKEQTAGITDMLTKKFGKDVSIEWTVDESLIGGLRVTVNSTQIDLSIKGKLEQVRKQLAG